MGGWKPCSPLCGNTTSRPLWVPRVTSTCLHFTGILGISSARPSLARRDASLWTAGETRLPCGLTHVLPELGVFWLSENVTQAEERRTRQSWAELSFASTCSSATGAGSSTWTSSQLPSPRPVPGFRRAVSIESPGFYWKQNADLWKTRSDSGMDTEARPGRTWFTTPGSGYCSMLVERVRREKEWGR